MIQRIKHYLFCPRFHFSRFQLNLVAIFFIAVGLLGGTYLTLSELWPRIFAASSPWNQTDWSGGEGQTAWSDSTKYSTTGLLVQDTFTDINGTSLGSHTPDQGGTWTTVSGTLTIQDNHVTDGNPSYPDPVITLAVIDAGSGNVEVTSDVTIGMSGASEHGIIIRYLDSNNYIWAGLDGLWQHPVIYKVVNGVATEIGGVSPWTESYTNGQVVTIRVWVCGDVLRLYIDDVLKAEITETVFQTKTIVGLYANHGLAGNWDDFSTRELNIDTSVAGEVTLARIEELTNTGFEADLSDWSAGSSPDMVSGLKAWFAADRITGLNDNDPVSSWNDLSGNSHNVSNTGDARPTYKTDIQNGLPVVRFDGIDDLLNTSGFGYDGANKNLTIFVVGTRRGAIVGGGSLITLSGAPPTYPWQGWSQGALFWEHQDQGYKLFVRRSDSGLALMDTLTTQDVFNVLALEIDPFYHRIYLNGALDGESAVASGAFNSDWFWIGGSPSGTGRNYKQWDIAEVIVCDSALSDTNRNNIETYLSDKYDISVSSPTLTATRDTVTTYNSSAGSAKLVPDDVSGFTQAVNVGNTDTYHFEAFAYTDGSAVTDSNLQLFAAGSAVSTSYTAVEGGWYKLTGTVAGVTAQEGYGVELKDGLLVSDSFTGEGSVPLTSHTPEFDKGGGGWVDGGSNTVSGGVVSSSTGWARIDAGSGNVRIETRMKPVSYGNSVAGRYSDDTHMVSFAAFEQADLASIYECNGGCSETSAAFAFDAGTYYDFKFEIGSDDVARYYVNGALVHSKTLTQSLPGTFVGFHTGVFDNFIAKESGGTPLSVYIDNVSLYAYPASGTLISSIFDAGFSADWETLTYSATTPAGTSVAVKIRTSNSSTMEGVPEFSSCTAIGSGSDISTNGCVTDTHRYIQYQVILSTTDQTATPTFDDISIAFTASDVTPPTTNASAIIMYRSNGGTEVSSNGWTNGNSPYFTWTAGDDDPGGSGLKGYCLYLGTDSNGDPATSEGLLGTSPVSTSGTTCQFIVSSTSVDFANASYKGETWLSTSNDPYYLNIKAVDNVGNIFSGSSEQFQFRFDNTAPTNTSYISCASGSFSNVADMSFNWPTSGGVASSDSNAGVLGWQYQINSTGGTWLGTTTESILGIDNYIPSTETSRTLTQDQDGSSIVSGTNIVYFRTADAVGNTSSDGTIRTCNLSYGGEAPSFGGTDTVTVTPSTSESNSFALSWPEATPASGQTVAHYYYMINTTPPSTLATLQGNASTYIDNGTDTDVSATALSNVNKGTNTVYVVAIDNASTPNYSPSNYIAGTFTLNSTDPDNPENLVASDSSIKSQSQWNVTLTWTAPTYQGAGNLTHLVYRSSDGSSFSQVGTTTGLSYVDNTPSSAKYYYKVYSKDGADAQSSGTNAVSITPTGKWTTAPTLDSGPSAGSITTKKATITWSTSRTSDSKISYGATSGSYNTVEPSSSSQVTLHSIQLTGLDPGTTYYYKAKWTDEDGNTGTSDEESFSTASAPTVKDVSAKNIGLTTATIEFTSKDASKVKIYYGETTSFGGAKETSTSTSETTYTSELTGLDDGTKYYYKINTFDSESSEYEGTILDFTTLPRPKISNVRIQQVANTAQSTILITWDTNTNVSSIVTYYPQGNPSEARDEINVALTKGEHRMIIRGLLPQTDYIIVVKGRDKIGNEAVSDSQRLTTATDTRPPQISEFLVEGTAVPPTTTTAQESTAQLVVSWNTDEPGTSQVEFGEGTGTTYSSKTQEDSNLTLNHLVIISGLTPSKVYHLRAISHDKAGNTGNSIDTVTITPKATENALNLVITNLQAVFGFLGGLIK